MENRLSVELYVMSLSLTRPSLSLRFCDPCSALRGRRPSLRRRLLLNERLGGAETVPHVQLSVHSAKDDRVSLSRLL
jgi:hypothetical protein